MKSPSHLQITILVAEAQPIYRLGLKRLLGVEEDFRVVAAVATGPAVSEAVRKFRPDLLLLCWERSTRHPFDIIREVRKIHPQTRAVLLSESTTDEGMIAAIQNGVRVVLPKEAPPETLISALHKAYRGETFLVGRPRAPGADSLRAAPPQEAEEGLTARELEIISLIAQGFPNKEIAAHLYLSEQTIKNKLRIVFDKLGVSDRLELALYAIHHRLFSPPDSGSASN
ncbi:MAG: response regulator transcription factor [Acidobacteria bacterium]|nr:response regulator transcription factor [Acidobacteriota bacterium]